MIELPQTFELSCALAVPSGRAEAAAALARALGAEALLIFLYDGRVGALVPAGPWVQRVPGGPTWVTFLQRCEQPGEHHAEAAWPDLAQRRPVHALSRAGFVLVVIGPQARLPAPEEIALPLLAGLLQAELAVALAQGQVQVERQEARHANALTAALERARAELERALNESARLTRELQQANQAKDEFLALLGHELRNPLAPIATALQLLKMRGQFVTKEHAIIERHVAHLTGLVNDLLDVARVTRGKVELNKSVVELSVIVERAAEMASSLIESHRHTFRVDVPPTGCRVEVDVGRMCQVVSNLLTNAARYTPPGGLITVRGWRDGEEVRLTVRDTGVGIDPALMPHLWEPFVQGARAKGQGGLGLGLSLVKNLTRLHGGEATVRSEGPNRGSEFELRLPAASVSPPVETEVAAQVVRREATVRRNVLVVDDNVDAAEILAEALQLEGYDVRVCHDGPQALGVVESFVPDVAILDIGLPTMDGYELARRLKSRPALLNTRLIAATGYGRESERAAARSAGFDHHLVKPLELMAVLALVEGAPAAS